MATGRKVLRSSIADGKMKWGRMED